MPKKRKRKVKPTTAIIVPVWNQLFYTKKFIYSVLKNTKNYRLYIIDNGSTDGTDKFLKSIKKKFSDLKILTYKTNRGVVAAWNKGVKEAYKDGCKYFAIVNNDIQVTQNWLPNLLEVFKDKDVWVVCPDSSIGELPVGFPDNPYPDPKVNRGKYFTSHKLGGWCFATKRDVFTKRLKEDGYFFDPQFKVLWYEDTDFEAFVYNHDRLIVTVTDSYIHHYESKSINVHPDKAKYIQENKLKFEKKYPFFNRNKETITRYKREDKEEKEKEVKMIEDEQTKYGKKYQIVSPSNYPPDPKGHIKHGGKIFVAEVPEWAKNKKYYSYELIEKIDG